VHKTQVIAEDLRDILVSQGFATVVLVRRVADIPVDATCLVILDGTLPELHQAACLEGLGARNLPTVVLDGHTAFPAGATRIERVDVPFRSEEVIAAVGRVIGTDRVGPTDPA
jgi:hypothetical protein